jgi:hypothetical protein
MVSIFFTMKAMIFDTHCNNYQCDEAKNQQLFVAVALPSIGFSWLHRYGLCQIKLFHRFGQAKFPGLNFINVLRAHFLYEHLFSSYVLALSEPDGGLVLVSIQLFNTDPAVSKNTA